MKFSFKVFLILAIMISSKGIAQDRWFINPGFKLGYAFGENGGFISGFEISVTNYPDARRPILGACVSLEQTNSITLVHCALEASGLVGISLGPTMVVSEGGHSVGIGATVFGGLVVMPYYRLTYIPNWSTLNEIGSFIKIPLKLSGPEITHILF